MARSKPPRRRRNPADVARNEALIEEIERRLARIRQTFSSAGEAAAAYGRADEPDLVELGE